MSMMKSFELNFSPLKAEKVRPPPQSGWLDRWGCLKGS